jgi:hypothetical protein
MNTSYYHALMEELHAKSAKLIAVSKTKPIEDLQEAYALGIRDFGENKVQELAEKAEVLPKDIRWHMIGHLQRNKVKYIVPFVHLIHSVDSIELLAEIDKQAAKIDRQVSILLQVHIAKEEEKFGFSADEVRHLFQSFQLMEYSYVQVCGMMGMATNTDDMTVVFEEFSQLQELFHEIKSRYFMGIDTFSELSMGMSGDYKVALACGSTMVRVGSALFGSR